MKLDPPVVINNVKVCWLESTTKMLRFIIHVPFPKSKMMCPETKEFIDYQIKMAYRYLQTESFIPQELTGWKHLTTAIPSDV